MNTNKSIEAFINKQKAALAAFENDATSPLRIAAQDTHAKMNERIFEQGLNANGAPIGKYNDSDPFYINPEKAVRKGGLKAQGKTGETKFKNGKPHKTAYVSSYKDYRQKVGRPTDKKDYVLSSELRSDFANGTIPTPEKVDNYKYVAGVRKEVNAKKIQGLKEKDGEVFKATIGERQNFKEVQEFELNRLLSK